MRKFTALFLVFSLFLLTACSGEDATIKEIKKRDELRVGVKVDVPNFGLENADTGVIEGMEIDLAKLIAEKILGDNKKIKLIPVMAQTREPKLKNGEIDIAIATFTITEERQKNFLFTKPYYTDEISFLVKKSLNAAAIEQLNNKKVGVVMGSTTYDAVKEESLRLGLTFNYYEFNSYPEIKAALDAGTVDAFATDKSILSGYKDDTTVIFEKGFKPQEYGMAVNLENTKFKEFLDSFLTEIQKDGSLEKIFIKWGLAESK